MYYGASESAHMSNAISSFHFPINDQDVYQCFSNRGKDMHGAQTLINLTEMQ